MLLQKHAPTQCSLTPLLLVVVVAVGQQQAQARHDYQL
jgi:hypothetical protein